jgi:hypothetical protein
VSDEDITNIGIEVIDLLHSKGLSVEQSVYILADLVATGVKTIGLHDVTANDSKGDFE